MLNKNIFCPYRTLTLAFQQAARETRAICTPYYQALPFEGTPRNFLTSVAQRGPRTAKTVIVVSSGVHGVELFCGSTLQRAWLPLADAFTREGKGSVRFVFAHALNPYGTAADLRGDEKNIDPNRNFITDFSALPQTSTFYQAFAPILAASSLSDAARLKTWCSIWHFAGRKGFQNFTDELVKGQYGLPNILFYGGAAPSWTHNTWRKIVRDHVTDSAPERIIHLDLHSGSGPYGEMQILRPLHVTPAMQTLWGALAKQTGLEAQAFSPTHGDIINFWPQIAPHVAEIIPMTIEVGTSKWGGVDTLDAMIRRNVLHTYFHDAHALAGKIRRQMRGAFTPNDPQWRRGLLRQGERLFSALLNECKR